jgi:hypothetical protein
MRWLLVVAMLIAGCEQECKNEQQRSNCCKVCTSGKPCGDTCIEDKDTCHTAGGCACAR